MIYTCKMIKIKTMNAKIFPEVNIQRTNPGMANLPDILVYK